MDREPGPPEYGTFEWDNETIPIVPADAWRMGEAIAISEATGRALAELKKRENNELYMTATAWVSIARCHPGFTWEDALARVTMLDTMNMLAGLGRAVAARKAAAAAALPVLPEGAVLTPTNAGRSRAPRPAPATSGRAKGTTGKRSRGSTT
jgi:hypothetical protein